MLRGWGAYLIVLAAGAEAENEQVSVGVGAGEMLAVRRAFAVEHGAMALPLDLKAAGRPALITA